MGYTWNDNAHLVEKHDAVNCKLCRLAKRKPNPPEIPEFLKDTFQSFKKEDNAQAPVVPSNEAPRC